MARFPRPQFSLKTLMLLSLGFALGYAWNLYIWGWQAFPGTEANMVTFPPYVIEPPDVLCIDIASKSDKGAPVITGDHVVSMDGRVKLGQYGSVYVAGMTIEQTEDAIRQKLAGQLKEPQVLVDVRAYNSKVYYVVQQSGRFGNVLRLPSTGNETVIDAIASVGNVSQLDEIDITLSRPALNGIGPPREFEIDWKAIAHGASASTNYQIYPGDRLIIARKNPPDKPSPAAAMRPTPDPAVIPALAETPVSAAAAYSRSGPYHLSDDVQYYQPAPVAAPTPASLPNYYLYVKPQLDKQRKAVRDPNEPAASKVQPEAPPKRDGAAP
jgi:protein involved in polysaccharide export with SLBB domain